MPVTQQRPSARHLLGGRWAISLRGWLIGSVLVLVVPLVSFNAILHATPPELAVLIAAQWIAPSAVLLIAHLTVFRHRRTTTVALGWVVALAVLMGVARAAAVLLLEGPLSGPDLGWEERSSVILAIVPSTAVFVLLTTYVIAVEDWLSTERARLLRFEIDAEAARLRALGALDATRAVMTTRIRDEIEEQLGALDDARAVGEERLQLSGTVLEAAAGYVRPTSHALWNEREAVPHRHRLRTLERSSLEAPLPILLPLVLWLVIALPLSIARGSVVVTVVGAAALLLGMVVAYPLGHRAIRRFAPAPRHARARGLALTAIVFAMLPQLLVLAAAGARSGSGFPGPLFATSIMITLFLTVGVSLAQAGLRLQGQRLNELRTQAEEADFQRLALESATEQMQRDLALYLHGTVQAGLVASAYAIQDAAVRGDEVALEHAIAEARAAATRVGEHAPAPPAADLSALRADIDETWRGMLAITWTLPSAEISVRHVDRIGNVVQECLANASIHGSATAASVRIAAEGDGIVVEIADNGSGPTGGGPGLGSAVLNEATASRWTIAAAADGGAQVRAVIPV